MVGLGFYLLIVVCKWKGGGRREENILYRELECTVLVPVHFWSRVYRFDWNFTFLPWDLGFGLSFRLEFDISLWGLGVGLSFRSEFHTSLWDLVLRL